MNRRTFLFEYGSLLLVASGLPWAGGCRRSDPSLSSLEELAQSRRNLDHASRVGAAWIESSASVVSADSLGNELLEGIEAEIDVDALASALRRKHRSDFDASRTSEVRGWILSRTEVALYALISLSQGDGRTRWSSD